MGGVDGRPCGDGEGAQAPKLDAAGVNDVIGDDIEDALEKAKAFFPGYFELVRDNVRDGFLRVSHRDIVQRGREKSFERVNRGLWCKTILKKGV